MQPESGETNPYYAVIFTSRRTEGDRGYEDTAARMLELAGGMEGFLGVDSVREGRDGVTVCYWRDLEDIRRWKAETEHVEAQRKGRTLWYESYRVRICRVERDYGAAEL